MRRRLRHVRRPSGVELATQHRDHFLTEQVQLLEDGLQRKAGMVHQEELALVVAEVLAEGEGLLDDLLRASRRSTAFAQ